MPAIWKTQNEAPAQTGAFSLSDDGGPDGGAPVARVILRPSRSLSLVGFAWLMLITWAFLLLPLIPLLGSGALWVMLPFLLAVLVALWLSFRRSYRDGELYEELTLWPDLIRVHRHNPRANAQSWQASPYWTRLRLLPEGGPVENYITLKGQGREIELGAFLSPDERVELYDRLESALARARAPRPGSVR